MPGFSDYTEAKAMGWVNGVAPGTPPATRYVSLHNGDPTDVGTGGAEVTTNIRAAGRVVGTFTLSGSTLTSNADVDFGTSAGAASVSHWGLWDAASGGNLLLVGTITGGAQSVVANNQVKFASGSLTATID